MKILYINPIGGLGNKLFYILTGLSLSNDYDLELYINDYNSKAHGKKISNYQIFDNLKIINVKNIDDSKILIKQKNFYYEKILLDSISETNYIIDKDKSGFFQSYKFFWHNKDTIKNFFNVYNDKFTKLRQNIIDIGNHIAIHIRLTDYINSQFINLDIKYFSKILENYTFENTKIILFSDDYKKALEILNNIAKIKDVEIINANDITCDDEEQFIMLCQTNIRICSNSTFSLLSCYFNEIYNFNENSIYYFPNKWFIEGKENYKIEDFIILNNSKFKLVDINNLL